LEIIIINNNYSHPFSNHKVKKEYTAPVMAKTVLKGGQVSNRGRYQTQAVQAPITAATLNLRMELA
jgi:hypothetical protein